MDYAVNHVFRQNDKLQREAFQRESDPGEKPPDSTAGTGDAVVLRVLFVAWAIRKIRRLQ
ncbi:hypothetical protein KL86DES1_10140 [uncultured Desulfovibrio sp.]|uniref:Uncharacterized protein n=1 Tax=uncultured Desulfovibrio sp. TaxID=167968 RepID=A0A212KXP5_9BACT|nr:hypothetical protein KL86DES1_10140 [uncultured Desulfovibrio sp.]VZH35353.1 conserved protein of unknown function [Desulfovibrio sp. 86]